jgi:hypothetical protein
MQYEAQLTRGSWKLRTKSLPGGLLQGSRPIVCDSKHLVKRIRYRFVSSSQFSIGFGTEERFFSLLRIQQVWCFPDIVLDNSQITKMHDLLPLYLFSPMTFTVILSREYTPELVLSPWCLLTAALPLVGFNTKTRGDLLEAGYWFLDLYEELLTKVGLPLGVTQEISPGGFASLYSKDQLRDGLNTFMSLIPIIRESPTAVFLSHLRSDPLEHAFGQARVRYRDANTMEKMLKGFSFNLEKIPRSLFLDLVCALQGGHSMGVIYEPWSESPILSSLADLSTLLYRYLRRLALI